MCRVPEESHAKQWLGRHAVSGRFIPGLIRRIDCCDEQSNLDAVTVKRVWQNGSERGVAQHLERRQECSIKGARSSTPHGAKV